MKSKYDSVPADVTSYCIGQILNLLMEFFDSIAGGYFKFYHNELPTINNLFNKEVGILIEHLNAQTSAGFRFDPPYDEFEYDSACQTWFSHKKPIILSLKADIETTVLPGSGSGSNYPRNFGAVMLHLNLKVKDYALKRAKWDADQFAGQFKQNEQQSSEIIARQEEFFPIETFDFIEDLNSRLVICSYYKELRATYFTQSTKSSIILSGALIEALLIQALMLVSEDAKKYYKSPQEKKSHQENESHQKKRSERDIADWSLSDLIKVSLKLKILPTGLETQLIAVKNFRNFVHIQRAIKDNIQLTDEYREICKNALSIVLRHVKSFFEDKIQK